MAKIKKVVKIDKNKSVFKAKNIKKTQIKKGSKVIGKNLSPKRDSSPKQNGIGKMKTDKVNKKGSVSNNKSELSSSKDNVSTTPLKESPMKPSKKKSKQNKEKKFLTKTKKTTSFKNKPLKQKLKVKTASIFNQKLKPGETNIDHTINLNKTTVQSGIKGLFNLISKNKNDKSLFDDDTPIFLHFSLIKIGKTSSRTLRVPLKHSLLKDSSEICLIIPDMKGNNLKDYEKTIEHWEDLLQKEGVDNIKTIMTYYQLRTDYSEFELKRKLVELYDIFLVDGRISRYVEQKLGKIFHSKKKLPIPIRSYKNIKKQIQYGLLKTSTNMHGHGDNFIIQVGHSDMTEDQIYDNILEVCGNLSKQLPGGWNNIRGLNIKTAKSASIPIYYTLKNSAEIATPARKVRPKAYQTVTGELSTVDDRIVTVLPSGVVRVKQREKSKQNKEKKSVKAQKGHVNNNPKLSGHNKSNVGEVVDEIKQNGDDENHTSDDEVQELINEAQDIKSLKVKKLQQKKVVHNVKKLKVQNGRKVQNKLAKKSSTVLLNGKDEQWTNNKKAKELHVETAVSKISKKGKLITKSKKGDEKMEKLKSEKLVQEKQTKKEAFITKNDENEFTEQDLPKEKKSIRKHLEDGAIKSKKSKISKKGKLITKSKKVDQKLGKLKSEKLVQEKQMKKKAFITKNDGNEFTEQDLPKEKKSKRKHLEDGAIKSKKSKMEQKGLEQLLKNKLDSKLKSVKNKKKGLKNIETKGKKNKINKNK